MLCVRIHLVVQNTKQHMHASLIHAGSFTLSAFFFLSFPFLFLLIPSIHRIVVPLQLCLHVPPVTFYSSMGGVT